MSGGISNAHRRGVDHLVANGARRRGLSRVLELACGVAMDPELRLMPDAFTVRKSKKRITLYEIAVTHTLDEDKLVRCRSLRDRLAKAGWTLRLMYGGPLERLIEINIDSDDVARDVQNEKTRRVANLLGVGQ